MHPRIIRYTGRLLVMICVAEGSGSGWDSKDGKTPVVGKPSRLSFVRHRESSHRPTLNERIIRSLDPQFPALDRDVGVNCIKSNNPIQQSYRAHTHTASDKWFKMGCRTDKLDGSGKYER
ncbi:hypothetical protein BDW22DRAFT_802617 [Trametopsis cervina]|nr:hypothetical protein BDW22DRAFT_802617 [Trametopsis cervina]